MRWTSILAAAAIALAVAPTAHAEDGVTVVDFHVRNAQDLVDLCAATGEGPLVEDAINFCHGFASGAWQYHQAQAAGPDGHRLVCPPDPAPSRTAILGEFVTWARAHAEHLEEPAVEALFRFLVGKWPCPEAASAPKKEESR